MKGFRFIVILLLAWCLLPLPPSLAQTTRIIFLHHSCGQNLIDQGGVREGLTALGYEFYDHGYNGEGLRDASGEYTGRDFNVPDDNTDPDGIAGIFAQPLHDPPDNAFSHLMQYDVIAFKSCYPTSNIGSDDQLNQFKGYYLGARDRMDQYPDKLFIVVTQPPQVPGSTDADEARRARALADWLKSDEFLGGHPNVSTFDFFGHLAGADNMLRPEYRYDDYDGHPNERANRAIGPLFVDFIDQSIRSYQGSGPRPTPEVVAATVPSGGEEPPVIAPIAAGVGDDFEVDAERWTDVDRGTITCELDQGVAHGGSSSLRMDFVIEYDGWVDCGRTFDELQDWRGGEGIAFWVRSDVAISWVTLTIFSGDQDDPTPFEVIFAVAGDETWAQHSFAWADFDKVEWAGDAGIATIDTARIIAYGIGVGAYDEGAVEGALWVDDLAPSGGESPSVVAPAATDEPVVSTEEPVLPTEELGEDDQRGPICGFMALPLGMAGAILVLRRHQKRVGDLL
jgi:hypothetical protein